MANHESQVNRTNEAIRQAMMELVTEKDFSMITNKEVCERAGIHRTTLKVHYESLRDILEDIKKDIFKSFKGANIDGTTSIRDRYISLLSLIKQYRHYFLAYFSSDESVLQPAKMEEALLATCKKHMIMNICTDVDDKYAVVMMRSASKAAIEQWLKNGCKEKPEVVAEYILHFFSIPENMVFDMSEYLY